MTKSSTKSSMSGLASPMFTIHVLIPQLKDGAFDSDSFFGHKLVLSLGQKG